MCGTDEENRCGASIKKNMPPAIVPFFFSFFSAHTHTRILNKRRMLGERLMGCGNSHESIQTAPRESNALKMEKFFLLLRLLLLHRLVTGAFQKKEASMKKMTLLDTSNERSADAEANPTDGFLQCHSPRIYREEMQ